MESEGGRPVVVLGMDISDNLFPYEDPSEDGQGGSSTFRVVGVLDKQGSFLGMISLDNQVILPLERFEKLFGGSAAVRDHRVKAPSVPMVEETKEEVRAYAQIAPTDPVRDDFAINQTEAFKQVSTPSAPSLRCGPVHYGPVALCGGDRHHEHHVLSVTERPRDRRAESHRRASPHDLLQFLIESAILCLLGGLIGVAVAFLRA